MQSNNNNPLTCGNLIAGIIITVVGGYILAFIIQDSRFDPRRRQEFDMIETMTPPGTQVELDSPNFTLFGPTNGKLDHDPTNSLVEDYYADVNVQDFVVESVFFNPYDAFEGTWSYGIFFRDTGELKYLFYIRSDKTWYLRLLTQVADNTTQYTEKASGSAEFINNSANGSNHIRLFVLQETAYVFINQTFITTLNIAGRLTSGDIAVATGLLNSDEIQGKSTAYQLFQVLSFTK